VVKIEDMLTSTESHQATEKTWTSETVYNDSADFFAALKTALNKAKTSIDIEVYILEQSQIAREILEILEAKAKQGVAVRITVDGIGSSSWVNSMATQPRQENIELRVYHPAPWPLSRFRWGELFRLGKFMSLLGKINRRNHKKVFIIDRQIAFVGSHNITDTSLHWRETGVSVAGEDLFQILFSFEFTWTRSHRISDLRMTRPKEKLKLGKRNVFRLVKTNETRKRRLIINKELTQAIDRAKYCVRITTPYFVPPATLMRALTRAALRGVKVQLLIAGPTDVPILKWVTPFYCQKLLPAGAKIYHYSQKILHAKVTLVDQQATVGSSNFNHRSFFRDLEIRIQLNHRESFDQLNQQFDRDLEHSVEVPATHRPPMIKRILGRFLLLVKDWM
jgi:cardiolipin synthase